MYWEQGECSLLIKKVVQGKEHRNIEEIGNICSEIRMENQLQL
jgi:hypothetical protein